MKLMLNVSNKYIFIIIIVFFGYIFQERHSFQINEDDTNIYDADLGDGDDGDEEDGGIELIYCKNSDLRLFNHQTYCFSNSSNSPSLLSSSFISPSLSKSIQHQHTSIKTYSLNDFEKFCYSRSRNEQRSKQNDYMLNTNNPQSNQVHYNSRMNKFSLLNDSADIHDVLNVNVFIYDFSMISGEVIIDFGKYDSNLVSSSSINKKSSNSTKSLIINLVARQFMSFRLLNIPIKSAHLDKLIILLNGECSLDIIEKKQVESSLKLQIETHHSPIYDISSIENNRNEWLNYLKQKFYPSLNTNDVNLNYMEHLSRFCHLSHVTINLNNLLIINNYDFDSPKANMNYVNSLELAQHLELVDLLEIEMSTDYNIIKKCSLTPIEFLSKSKHVKESVKFGKLLPNVDSNSNQEQRFTIYDPHSIHSLQLSNKEQVYLFEIEQNVHSTRASDYLRIFVKECDISHEYVLFLYVILVDSNGNLFKSNTTKVKLKKLIFDDSNCHFKIYSNADVYDVLDEKYQNLINLTEMNIHNSKNNVNTSINDEDLSSNNQKKAGADFSTQLKLYIAQLFNLNSIFYLKITKIANDVEFRFLAQSGKSEMAPHKFLNKLQQQLFIYKHEYSDLKKIGANLNNNTEQLKALNYSVKFVLAETDLLEYFKERYLSLEKYLLSDNEPHTSNTNNKADEHKYFFITNKACRTNYLYNELTYQADTYLILFNSRMYDVKLNGTLSLNECFYFDQFSQTFYMTFAFSLHEISYIQTVYFTMKQQAISTDKNKNNPNQIQKTNNHVIMNLEKLREKSSIDYFHNVLDFTIKSDYTSKTLKATGSLVENLKKSRINKNKNKNPKNDKPRHKKTMFKTSRSRRNAITENQYKLDKFYLIELNTLVELNTLDDLISWNLEDCWLSDHECQEYKLISDPSETGELIDSERMQDFDTNYDENYDYEYNEDEYNQNTNSSLIDNDIKNLDLNSFIENYNNVSRLNNRTYEDRKHYARIYKFKTGNENENESGSSDDSGLYIDDKHLSDADRIDLLTLRFNYLKTKLNLNKEGTGYEYHMNISLKFINLINANKKKYILCNLKPYLNCNSNSEPKHHSVGNDLSNSTNESRIHEICDSTLKIHKNIMQAKKLKTILLGKFDPTNYNKLISNFSFDSTTTKQTGVKCPVYNIIEKKRLNSTNKLWPNNNSSNKTNNRNPNESNNSKDSNNQPNGSSQLQKWLDDNKLTLFLVLLIIVFSIIILLLLKLLDKNMYCPKRSDLQPAITDTNNNNIVPNTISLSKKEEELGQQLHLLNNHNTSNNISNNHSVSLSNRSNSINHIYPNNRNHNNVEIDLSNKSPSENGDVIYSNTSV